MEGAHKIMFELRQLHESELEEWYTHCSSAFKIPQQFFSDPYKNDSTCNPNSIFIAQKEGKMVSGIRTLQRVINISRQELSIWGLTDAATLDGFRNSRVMIKLFEMANSYYREKHITNCLLFTYEKAQKVFQYLGFESYPLKYVIFTLEPKDIHLHYTLHKAVPEDLSRMMVLYTQQSPKFNWTICRDKEYWLNWVCNSNRHIFTIELYDHVCGYIICDDIKRNTDKGVYLRISEYFVENEVYPDYLGILYKFVSQYHFPKRIRLPYPLCPVEMIKDGVEELDIAMKAIIDTKYKVDDINSSVFFNTDRF